MKNKEMVNLINLRRSVALNKKAMAEKIGVSASYYYKVDIKIQVMNFSRNSRRDFLMPVSITCSSTTNKKSTSGDALMPALFVYFKCYRHITSPLL